MRVKRDSGHTARLPLRLHSPMMKSITRPAILALSILAACLAGWLWLQANHTAIATPDASDPLNHQIDDSAPPRPEQSTGTTLVERDTAKIQAPSAGKLTLKVLVVDAADQPVPAADIAFSVPAEVSERWSQHAMELAAWSTATVQSNSQGEARLLAPEPSPYYMVYARQGDRWGASYVREEEQNKIVTVTINPDVTIRARVLDPRGRPVAGVPIGLCDEEDVPLRRTSHDEETNTPDGVATFYHAQRYILPRWGQQGALLLNCATAEPVYSPIDFTAIPTQPIDLHLPATGSVVVKVVDKLGAPHIGLAERVDATLSVQTDKGEHSNYVTLNGNQLEIPHVELGLQLHLELESEELSGAVDFAGPTQQGERVEQQLIATRQPTLSGRLVNDRGEPQKGYWHAVHVQTKPGYQKQYFETTDDGYFHIPIPPLTDNPGAARGIRFERTIPTFEEQAWINLGDLSLISGRNEIGNIVLSKPPIVVAGWVVDDAGQPVSGAQMQILYGTADAAYNVSLAKGSGFTSTADGAFELRAYWLADELLLGANKGWNFGELVRLEQGTTGVRYVLPRVGQVVIPVTFVGAMTVDHALFTRTNRASGSVKGTIAESVFEDGKVHWRAVAPGRYDFAIRIIGTSAPLALISDVEVLGEESKTLPAQEVGEGVQEIQVQVVGPNGAPVKDAFVAINPSADGNTTHHALPAPTGSVRLLVPETPCEIMVAAPGHATRTVYGVTEDTIISLEAGVKVELHVSIPVDALRPNERLCPEIRTSIPKSATNTGMTESSIYLGERAQPFSLGQLSILWAKAAPINAEGNVTFYVPGPGNYCIDWEVAGESWRELHESSRRTFTVESGAQRTKLSMKLSREDLK